MTQIVSVAVPRPLDGLFTYRVPEELRESVRVGGWVRVPFGRAVTHAYVVEAPKPISDLPPGLEERSLKSVIEGGGDQGVIPADVLRLCEWVRSYYHSPLGEVLACAAPPAALGLKSRKRDARAIEEPSAEPRTVELTPDQQEAVEAIERVRAGGSGEAGLRVAVLDGVTGSGKTEVYLEVARRTLRAGKSVLLLLPEIALTPQLHSRLEAGLGRRVGLWHSALADGVRRDQWAAIRSGEVRAVVGARSAVFVPIRDLGLIVVDEEHDSSYKQEDRVRYHARDVAIVRAKQAGALAVLGSATPGLETLERVREGRYGIARLPKRIGEVGMPTIEIVDLAVEERVPGIQAPLAQRTLAEIQRTLDAGEQAMVFLNRRGFASFLTCSDCRWVPGCPQCSISLTVHKRRRDLACHVCGHREPIPDTCPECKGAELAPVGAGTESLEEELPRLVNGMTAIRLDRDRVTSASRLEELLNDFAAGKANTLLGTQMLVKGHDFPGVTLVVVVCADALFRWPDFRAPERAFQVLAQVAGRAGRRGTVGRVLIQAYATDHPVLRAVKGEVSRDEFLESERELRQALRYPPFGRLARLRFESSESDEARKRAEEAARALAPPRGQSSDVELLGPSEAYLERVKGSYRWDLLLRSREVRPLHAAVSRARALAASGGWPMVVDVDPAGLA